MHVTLFRKLCYFDFGVVYQIMYILEKVHSIMFPFINFAHIASVRGLLFRFRLVLHFVNIALKNVKTMYAAWNIKTKYLSF